MNLEDYLALPYPITLIEESAAEGRPRIWFAKVDDLPGCMSQGDSAEEAITNVREAMGAWIADALDDDAPVPLPRDEADYSGRFLVRVPRTLHRDLAREAEREGTSLNQFVTSALSGAVRWRAREQSPDATEPDAIVIGSGSRAPFTSVLSSEQPLQKGEVVKVVNVEPVPAE
jgi:predicted RNase H-like HicB family nuclease